MKPEFKIPYIPARDDQSGEEFAIENNEAIWAAMMVGIERLIEYQLESVEIFETNDGLVFELHRDDAADAFEKGIEYYLEREEYEQCAMLKTLKQKLYEQEKSAGL
jgi:hypothetical protein